MSALSVVAICVVGMALGWPAFRSRQFSLAGMLMSLALGIGFGIGVTSIGYFLALLLGQSGRRAAKVGDEVVLSLVAALVFWYSRKRAIHPAGADVPMRHRPSWVVWPLATVFSAALVVFVRLLIRQVSAFPHGSWDAWAIWNLHARFLFRAGNHWRDTFSNSIAWAHPDYPLVVPGAVARWWGYLLNDAVLVPMFISIAFTVAIVLLLFSSIAALRGWAQASLAGIVLLSTPFFFFQGTSGCADVPLAFFYLATLVLLAIQEHHPAQRPYLLSLAGLSAGLAAWTKNEGLVFLVSIVAAQGLIGVAQQKSLRGLKPLEPFCVGLAFPLCVFFYFKFRIAPASYFVQPFSDILAKITDLSRYRQVAAAIAIKAWHFGDWVLSAFATLSIYLLLAGVKKRNEDLPQIEIGLLTLFFTLCSYFAAYIVTPFSLAWHLESSLDRLLLQLWPSFLFIYFIVVRNLDEGLLHRPSSEPRSPGSGQFNDSGETV